MLTSPQDSHTPRASTASHSVHDKDLFCVCSSSLHVATDDKRATEEAPQRKYKNPTVTATVDMHWSAKTKKISSPMAEPVVRSR